jgi:hypothetical protein
MGLLARDTFDAIACAGYSRALNSRFGAQFRFLTIVSKLLINRPMLNRAIKAANVQAGYKNFLVDIAMANRRVSTVSSAYMLAKLAVGTIAWSR